VKFAETGCLCRVVHVGDVSCNRIRIDPDAVCVLAGGEGTVVVKAVN
jgi:hypothetical protein